MLDSVSISYKKNGGYEVMISDSIDGFNDALKAFTNDGKSKAMIITDSNVGPLYLKTIKDSVKSSLSSITEYVIEAGEASKNMQNALKCIELLKDNDFHRSDIIIALGGGVVGDLSGFVASTYMRGIKFVQLPTSLLAMADSSIGGKCAVDLDGYKNIIGSVYMPALVYENLSFLNTLNDREFACGMSEILKAGLIKNGSFYEWLIMNFDAIGDKDFSSLCYMLNEACNIKKRVVEADPYENGERMHLNFGHTIGHAIEKCSDFSFNHGESVALGMVAASFISWKRNLLSMEEFYEIRDMFVPFNLPISTDSFDIDKVISAIELDKKVIDGKLNFILLKKIGKAITVNDVSHEELKDAIENLIVEWD